MEKRRFQAEDIKNFRYISWPSISPDGRKIAYVSSVGKEEDGTFQKFIFVYDRQKNENTPLGGIENQDMPQFLEDDRLLYVSDRSGENQVWIRNLESGEEQQLTTARHGIRNFSVSKDKSRIAFELSLWQEEIENELEFAEMSSEERVAWEKELSWKPMEINDLTYKMDEWYGVRNGSLPRIGVVDAEGSNQRLIYRDSFEGIYPSLSDDGKQVVFLGFPYDGAAGRMAEIFTINITKNMEVVRKQLTKKQVLIDSTSGPIFVDGTKNILALYVDKDSFAFMPIKIDAASGEIVSRYDLQQKGKEICHGINPAVISRTEYGSKKPHYQIGNDGRSLYFLSSYHGRGNIYRIPLDTQGSNEIVREGETDIYSFAVGYNGTIAYVMSSFDMPGELYADGKRLTDSNSWLSEYELAETEEFWIDTSDGEAKLQVWLVHPIGQKEGKKYPAVLDIHGGPACLTNSNFWHEFQAIAATGTAVIYTNPRGSVGYGGKFCEGDISWSQKAVDDLLATVDACIGKGFIDSARIGITGGSYGGYMTNKLILRTDRFAAAVTQRCLINPATSYGTGDMGFISSSDGWQSTKLLDYLSNRAKKSLICDIDNLKIPVLILHGYKDYRCSFEQAEQFFVAAKERRPEVPIRLVMFPEENHALTRSGNLYNQTRHLREMLDWFGRYLTEGGSGDE